MKLVFAWYLVAPHLLSGSPEAAPPPFGPVSVGGTATHPDSQDRKPGGPTDSDCPSA